MRGIPISIDSTIPGGRPLFAIGRALFGFGRPRADSSSTGSAAERQTDREAVWIRLARNGDQDAFRLLVDRYADMAFETALRIVRSHEEAEEAAQEAFVKAWKALPRFREEARFSTWLYRIVTRSALDRARTMKTRGEREMRLEPTHLESLPSAEDEGKRLTDLMVLERILEELSPESRAVVTLYYLRDLPVNEVAEILEMPKGTVKTHLHRSRATLRNAWLRLSGEGK